VAPIARLAADPECRATTPDMTEPPRADPATAGITLVSGIIAGTAVGAGLGALVGLTIPLGIVGLFCGLGGGLALVYARFKNV
jgi:F0F1-type ATP synthase assembly protein I